jgi:kynurenine formamidase
MSTPLYGNTPAPQIVPHSSISEGDSSNTFLMTFHNHTGTHIDAPSHFVVDGKKISEYSLDELIFTNPVVIECEMEESGCISSKELAAASSKLHGADCLIINTSFWLRRGTEIYRTHNPGISSEAIVWLRAEFPDIRCIGIDSISISGFQNRNEGRKAHRAAFSIQDGLGKPLVIIEDMNLGALLEGDVLNKIIVLPWSIEHIDSAPCSVLAEIEQLEH